jgi:glucosylceramidase
MQALTGYHSSDNKNKKIMKTKLNLLEMLAVGGLLAVCGLGVVSACGNDNNNKPDDSNVPPVAETGDVTIYVTTSDRSFDFAKKAVDYNEKAGMSPTMITLNPTERFQRMDGFGGAVTGSTAYNLSKMTAADRAQFLKETFSVTEGMGYSYIRVSIGCSDFSLSEYTCWDNRNAGFALTAEETNYVIPVLQEIVAINPNIKILGSPWTCPQWMKVFDLTDLQPYESWRGGHLNPAHYQDYGTYFVKWIQAFQQAGIPIYSVTVQNEPLSGTLSASLLMSWEEQRDFVKTALSPKLKEAGLPTKIYLYDHNYDYSGGGHNWEGIGSWTDQNDYPLHIYDAGVDDNVVGAAYHNYGGNKSELTRIHNLRPDKDIIFSEASIGVWSGGAGRDLSKRLMSDMQEVALGNVNNWSNAVILWNLMLDYNNGPNREFGCTECCGGVDIDPTNYSYKSIIRNSFYYIMGHLSAVVKPGAIRIGTTGYTATNLTYTAFENPDGSYALVLVNNNNESKKITINDGTHTFTYDVPVKSVVSYLWK